MVTIPVQLSNELASRVLPLQERLPEIIELGLRQLVVDSATVDSARARVEIDRRCWQPRALSLCLPPGAGVGRRDTLSWRAGCRPVT